MSTRMMDRPRALPMPLRPEDVTVGFAGFERTESARHAAAVAQAAGLVLTSASTPTAVLVAAHQPIEKPRLRQPTPFAYLADPFLIDEELIARCADDGLHLLPIALLRHHLGIRRISDQASGGCFGTPTRMDLDITLDAYGLEAGRGFQAVEALGVLETATKSVIEAVRLTAEGAIVTQAGGVDCTLRFHATEKAGAAVGAEKPRLTLTVEAPRHTALLKDGVLTIEGEASVVTEKYWPAIEGVYGRFYIESRAALNHAPTYQDAMKAMRLARMVGTLFA